MRRFVLFIFITLFCVPVGAKAKPLAYTLIAPPRQKAAATKATYGPIAAYLTQATHEPFVFQYTNNWLTYLQDVRTNKAAVYFDGPSFIGWRIAHWHDYAGVALKGHLKFVVVTKNQGRPPTQIKDLVGRGICAFSPPNLGTLTLDSLFPNPERQPYTIVIHTFAEGIHDIVAGKCVAAIEPFPIYKHMMAAFPGQIHMFYKIPPLPNQGFSINSSVPPALRHKIVAALLRPAGLAATKRLRDMFGHKGLVRAKNSTYLPERKLLDAMAGF